MLSLETIIPFLVPFLLTFGGGLLVLLFIWWALHRTRTTPPPSTIHELVQRHAKNPIVRPDEEHDWKAQGTLNPAVIQDGTGRVHMLYRALGNDGVSRLGYASSADGIHFDDHVPYPVFTMQNPRLAVPGITTAQPPAQIFSPVLYPSGGSWGGCEDPRMVCINGRIYVSFNAFDGWDYIRIAVMSIGANDFFAKRWKWTTPLLISPTQQIHKNWVLFPEKIEGKYAILHSISPDIKIDYVDHLEELARGDKKIQSTYTPKDDKKNWDSRMRGAGPPPLKTDKGWLVLYHANSKEDSHRYKIGAMLLDLHNPHKVIARSPGPLLMPDMWYENDWKPGIVYACGAIIKDDNLFIYYGGGDKYVCVAHAPLQGILQGLTPTAA
jgi:predicted GH43/DUF377 family glycosyl hydrolase